MAAKAGQLLGREVRVGDVDEVVARQLILRRLLKRGRCGDGGVCGRRRVPPQVQETRFVYLGGVV